MLSNAYFVAKFRFDTADNEPAKHSQNVRKMHFRKMHRYGGPANTNKGARMYIVKADDMLDYDKDPAVQRSLRFFTLFDDVDLLVVDIRRAEVNIDV